MKKHYFLVPIIISILFVPLFVKAATAEEIRVQIQALTSQIAALQLQLNALITTNPQLTPPIASGTPSACPNLYRVLIRGVRGDDVVSLQKFLIAQRLLNSESATGYFGVSTEAAVQQWQIDNSIVASGDANTTGFGVIGMKTRAAIAAKCGTPSTLPPPSSCPAVTGGSCPEGTNGSYVTENGCMVLKCGVPSVPSECPVYSACPAGYTSYPSIDAKGCTILKCTLPNECPVYSPCPAGYTSTTSIDANRCTILKCTLPKVCPIYSACPLGTTPSTSVDGSGCTILRCNPVSELTGSLTATTKTTGDAPLAVTFNGSIRPISPYNTVAGAVIWIEYGDGSVDSSVGPGSFLRTHTYTSPGTYIAKLLWRPAYSPSSLTSSSLPSNTLGSVTVTVSGGATGTPTFSVISPNGGESLVNGQSFTIKWNTDGAHLGGNGSNLVKLSLIPLTARTREERPLIIGNFRAADLSYTWSPSSALVGDSYRLKAVLTNGTCEPVGPYPFTANATCMALSQTLASDESDGLFTIRAIVTPN